MRSDDRGRPGRSASSLRLARWTCLAPGLLCLGLGCGEETGPVRTGRLRIGASTTGTDIDADGYTIRIGLLPIRTLSPNGPPVAFDLVPETYAPALGGLAANCAVTGVRGAAVVRAGDTTDVTYEVACRPLPGTVRIAVATTGEDLDLDGYTVVLDGMPVGRVPANDSTAVTDLPAGPHRVALGGLAGNCAVSGEDTLAVTVAHSVDARADFALTCTRTGRIAFTGPDGQLRTVNQDGTGLYDLFGGPNVAEPAWSPDGLRIAFIGGDGAVRIVRSDGSDARRIVMTDGAPGYPSWSPDGSHLAVTVRFRAPAPFYFADSAAIYVCDTAGGDVRRITWGPDFDLEHAWSPDGSRLVFARQDSTGATRLFAVNADGSGPTQITDGTGDRDPAWSPQGDRLVFTRGRHLYLADPRGGGGAEALLPADQDTSFYSPNWSADGSQIMVSDRYLLYLVNVATRQVTVLMRVTANPGGLFWFRWRQ